ncbi:MAG: alpha-glucosidase [Actinomycetota bacterium]
MIYQIYPRSFLDTNGDGMGDLGGIRAKLDYLRDLGVDAIWLSPVFTSPQKDMGYDVADYCDVDPLFGDLATMDALIADAHARDIKVLLDWVPNHTSDQHPWFVESRSSRDNPKADWYWWRDATREDPPNNWEANFVGGPAWTWAEERQQVYLHNFLPEQPDLNWRNPEVVAAMHDTLRFWLDRGVDGFRIDVVHLLGKPESLPSIPNDVRGVGRVNFFDFDDTHPILRDIRALLDSYDGDRLSVGEVYLLSTELVAKYYGDNDELHLAFNFPPLYAPWDADAWRKRIDRVVDELPHDAWPTWVLSNHDNPRHRTRYGGSEAKARAAAVLLLTQRGTPFLYAGEELGLEDAVVPPEQQVDPGGRDGCRAPIPWDEADGNAMLDLYRELLATRRSSPALQVGDFAWADSAPGTLVYERSHGDDRRIVAINFTDEPKPVLLPEGEWRVEVSTHASDFAGQLAPDQAAVFAR